MKIAMITPSYPPSMGGLEGHVSGLARALSNAGVDVTVLSQGTHSELSREASGVTVKTFRSLIGGRTYRVAPALGPWVTTHRSDFDLIHAHGYHGAAAAMGALAAGEVPFVLTPHYHGGGHTAFAHVLHYGYRPLGTWLIKRAAAVICVSKAEALALEEREHTVRSRTLVIPNAPASTGLLSEASTRGAQLVLSLGRLVPYKNNRLLLDGFRLLDSDAELVIAGDGVERPALAAAARNDPRVRIVGQVDRPTLDRLLSSAWVVASLSGHEAFGMALLEGLLAGARVVVSDIPAHREVIELCSAEDRGALLPLPASPATVAAALGAALLAGPPSTSISGWTWDDIAQRTLRVYDTVLAAGSRRIVLTSLQV